MKLSEAGLTEIIGGATALLGTVGTLLKVYLDSRARQKEIDRLTEELTAMKDKRDELQRKVDEMNETDDANENKIRELKQKIGTIQTAFNVAFHTISEKLGPNDPLLVILKGYINNGTGNLTS